MAATAIEALKDQGLVTRAKADHATRLQGNPYVCPIPADVKPPVKARSTA